MFKTCEKCLHYTSNSREGSKSKSPSNKGKFNDERDGLFKTEEKKEVVNKF